jgi:hypothetical protein
VSDNLAFIQHLNPKLNFLGGPAGVRGVPSGLREVQNVRAAGENPLSEIQKGKQRADNRARRNEEVVSLLD